MPNTQPKIVARHDRPVTNLNHIEVPAHGATDVEYTKPQFERKHELADHEISLGDQKRSIVNDSVGERHHTSENQFDVAKRRKASIEANKKKSAEIFNSDRLGVSRQG